MTRAERAAVLEEARKLCLEIAQREGELFTSLKSRGASANIPAANQALGGMNRANECAEAIAAAKAKP